MAIQTINLGTYANDGKGDDLRTAFQKVNANLIELYSTVYGANVGSAPPTSGVEEGELWWSSIEGRLYVYYSGAWIDASPVDGFIAYNVSAIATTGGANIRLEGNDASIDDVKFASSTNITVTRTDANTITLSSDNYTGDLTGTVTGLLIGNVTGNVTGEHFGPVLGNLTGDVTGNLTGDVTGDVTGAASLNVLKTGDTLTGDISWNASGRGLTWGMNSDGASIKFYNVSDFDTDSRLEFQTTDNGNEYFSWTYATNGGSEVVESMRLTPNSLNNAALRIFGSITVDGDVLGNVTGNLTGDVTGNLTGDVLGDVTGNLTGDVTGNLTGNVLGDVTGNVTGDVLGDVTGNLTGNVLGDVTGNLTGNVLGDVTGNADTVTNGVYTTSSITALADVDTSTVIPTIGQGLIWSGANWIPGTVSTTENNTFEFGGFIKTFSDPVSYLLDAVGVDFGTFTVPATYTIDLGTF